MFKNEPKEPKLQKFHSLGNQNPNKKFYHIKNSQIQKGCLEMNPKNDHKKSCKNSPLHDYFSNNSTLDLRHPYEIHNFP